MGFSITNKLSGCLGDYKRNVIILIGLVYLLCVFGSIQYYNYLGYVLGMSREIEIIENYNTCIACDITFHTIRAESWDFKNIMCAGDEFYAPAIHVFLGLVYRVLNIEMELAYILFSNFIAYVLIPIAIWNVGGIYLSESRQFLAVIFYLFLTRLTLLFVGWGIIAHALGIFFSLMCLKYMCDYLNHKRKKDYINAILTLLLTVLTHQGAAVYLLMLFMAFLMLSKKYKTIALIVLIVLAVFITFPTYINRPLDYARGSWDILQNRLWWLLTKQWPLQVHPLLIVWGFYGIPLRWDKADKLFWLALLSPMILFFMELNGRTIAHTIPLVCIIAAKGFSWPRKHKLPFVLLIVWSVIVVLRGFLVLSI